MNKQFIFRKIIFRLSKAAYGSEKNVRLLVTIVWNICIVTYFQFDIEIHICKLDQLRNPHFKNKHVLNGHPDSLVRISELISYTVLNSIIYLYVEFEINRTILRLTIKSMRYRRTDPSYNILLTIYI